MGKLARQTATSAEDEVLDAAIIAAAQTVEHHEIARFGALVAWANQLGRHDCASLFEMNPDEEKAASRKLTKIAETSGGKLKLRARLSCSVESELAW
jgi:ferritin-like metal-binding protein YciE